MKVVPLWALWAFAPASFAPSGCADFSRIAHIDRRHSGVQGAGVTSRVQLWLSQDLTARIEEVEAISPRLLVTVASLPKQTRLVILVAHPPQQGNSQWTRDDFRDEFRCKELKYKCKVPDTERIFCIDATGRVGSEASDTTVQHAADQEDPNGSEFRAMLEDTDTFARTTLFSWDVT